MKRVAGQPDKKRKYLERLDEKQFPYLIADILFFVFNHKEIKILDGPGDGKRDILSINQEGKACITQCKYHNDFKTSVGSRETDEIAIALLKFKASNGIFATTGKLSPQAKREFINDFPDYNLIYLEGTDLIDIVLSSPLLTAVWINNESIELISKSFVIPFIVRDIIEDKSVKDLSGIIFGGDTKVIQNNISIDYFYPFRSPKNSFRESGSFIYCNHIVFQGTVVHIHEVDKLTNDIIESITSFFQKQNKLISFRIGTPFFANMVEENIKEKVKLDFDPITFIVSSSQKTKEQDYIIPLNIPDCIFPQRFGHLESPWAAWFFRKHNICLQVELNLPFEIQNDYFTSGMKDVHLQKLNESLFFILNKEQYKILNQILGKDKMPDWNCEYGFDGHLVGWLHPYLLDDSDFKSFRIEDEKFVLIENEDKLKEFINKLQFIEKTLISNNCQFCPSKKAISLSEFSSNPLFIAPEKKTYDSAYLYHFFNEIASPVYLQDRIYNFICIWDVPSYSFDSDTVEFVNQIELKSKYEFELSFDIKTTSRKENKYARLDLIYNVPEELSSSEFIEKVFSEVISNKKQIEHRLKTKNSDAILRTEYFWNQEIGIIFK